MPYANSTSHFDSYTTIYCQSQQENQREYSWKDSDNPDINQERQTKAILPFNGQIFKSVIGTATQDNVDTLQCHVTQLRDAIRKKAIIIHLQGKHLSLYISLNNKSINNIITMIQQQNDTAWLLTDIAFNWQVKIAAMNERTQTLIINISTVI